MTAAETHNPTKNIPIAVRGVWIRILLFYIIGVFMLGLICPFNDPQLVTDTGNAASSAWVVAVQRAGIKVLPHIANACFLSTLTGVSYARFLTVDRCSLCLVCRFFRFVHLFPCPVWSRYNWSGPQDIRPHQLHGNPRLRVGPLCIPRRAVLYGYFGVLEHRL